MAEFVVLSKMTLTMEEGTIAKWLVSEGDTVTMDTPLCSVENEKETEDMLSIYEGTILKLLAEEGEVYPVKTPIAVVGQPGEDIAALLATLNGSEKEEQAAVPQRQVQVQSVQGKMMPKVRKLIQQKGIDMDALIAFCGERKITEAEVCAFEQSLAGAVELAAGDRVVKASAMRKTIAKNMMESCAHTARLTNFMEVDLTDALARVQQRKQAGDRVSVTGLLVKATAVALKENEIINTVYREERGEIVYRSDINIACAVDLPEGLAAPVVKRADEKDVCAITAEIGAFAQKGKDGKLSNDDLKSGTFTVSNVGMLDVLTFTPIINYPQTAILGVGAVRTLPRYESDGTIQPRKIMILSITYDHRVIDGAPASRFLQSVKAALEAPEGLL